MANNSTVERALMLLDHLARHPGEHGVRGLAAALDLSPSTCFRLLETLRQAGFAHQNQLTEKYTIGIKAVQLGITALGTLDITAIAPARLSALVEETGESAFLAVRDGTQIVYLLKQEGSYSIRTTAELGSRRPLHCTALGKSFLAAMAPDEVEQLLLQTGLPPMTRHTITDRAALAKELAAVRARGFATDHEEIEEGLACVGAAIRDYRGITVAAISMAGPISRILPQEERLGRRVAAAALEISTALGFVPRDTLEPSGACS